MTETTTAVRHKRGDIREDGMVFWSYSKNCKGGEWWMTQEKFVVGRDKAVARDREYNANPEVKARRSRYNTSPEVKARMREYTASHKFKERRREYNANPEVKARVRRYNASPEVKARKHSYAVANKANKAAYMRSRCASDPLFNLASRLRCRIAAAFRNIAAGKPANTLKLLGADWVTIGVHLEAQFTDGMSWENRHLWHIDHRVPLASVKTGEEMIALCHYTNLQPLWARDNLSKSSKCLITGERHRLQPLD